MSSVRLVFERRTHPVETRPASLPAPASTCAAPDEAGQPAPVLACESCGKTFTSERGRKTHVRMIHELQLYESWQPDRWAAPSLVSPCGPARKPKW
jgi:hypothetical protein